MTASPDPLEHFKNVVDASRARVARLPSRIWLFGGQFNGNPDLPPSSIREAFHRAALHESYSWMEDMVRPEDYPEWLHFSGYEDLLLFERDAGFLSRAIVLFVESPGAIAELGAFALDDQLHKRLFVVIAQKYREDPLRQSFVNLGPIRRIETSTRADVDDSIPSNICVIESETPNTLTPSELDVIFRHLDAWLTTGPRSERFKKENPTHKLLLIADLVDLLYVLSERRLTEALTLFGIELDRSELRRLANLLDLLELVKLKERGSERFLVSRRHSSQPLLDYDGIEGRRFERLAFKTKAWESVRLNPHLAPLVTAS